MSERVIDGHEEGTASRRPRPRWVRVLGWVNLAAAALWLVLVIVAFAMGRSGGAPDYDALSWLFLLFLPLLAAWRFAPITAALVVMLLVAVIILSVRRRRGMPTGAAIWAYSLAAWTVLWAALWIGGIALSWVAVSGAF